MGVSVGNADNPYFRVCTAGTLGMLVGKNGYQYALSNSHVYGVWPKGAILEQIGTTIDQPGTADYGCANGSVDGVDGIGLFEENIPQFDYGIEDNTLDAALALCYVGDCSPTITGIGQPSIIVKAPVVGLHIQAQGRTSMVTGQIVATDDFTYIYDYYGNLMRYDHQVFSDAHSYEGNSGSVWLTKGSCPAPVGLFFSSSPDFGGTSAAAPIQAVLSHFGVSIIGQNCTPTTALIADNTTTVPSETTKVVPLGVLPGMTEPSFTTSGPPPMVEPDDSDFEPGKPHMTYRQQRDAIVVKDRWQSSIIGKVWQGTDGKYHNNGTVPGVIGMGIGDDGHGKPAIFITVLNLKAARAAKAPKSLDGYPVKYFQGRIPHFGLTTRWPIECTTVLGREPNHNSDKYIDWQKQCTDIVDHFKPGDLHYDMSKTLP
jgi:hypothetical protein